jgi:hypothetical protein
MLPTGLGDVHDRNLSIGCLLSFPQGRNLKGTLDTLMYGYGSFKIRPTRKMLKAWLLRLSTSILCLLLSTKNKRKSPLFSLSSFAFLLEKKKKNHESLVKNLCRFNSSHKISSIRNSCLFFINMSKILSTRNVR